ncbi:MAG TPA: hypothetical protein VGR41_10670 [Actinomycetota bacterium]|nr:hypothetical protein [Actinomycetota bacterium]
MDRQELLDREERSWAAFWAEVGRVPEGMRANGDALPGWSVHDLVWHCAKWADFCGEHFESLGSGSFVDPFDAHPDEYWDGVNADIANESKALPWDEVQAGAPRARARARAALMAPPDVAEDAARWWGEETFVHYDEHAEHVRAFVDG